MTWQPLHAPWLSLVPSHANAPAVPATLATPTQAWAYGAITEALTIDRSSTIRIRAKALKGRIGLCLISEDCSDLASSQHVITPADGDAVVQIAFSMDKAPARLLVRNYGDEGRPGEVAIESIDIAASA